VRILKERREKWNGKGKYKEAAAPDTNGLPTLPEGWGNINLSNYVKIPEVFHKKLKRSHLRPNDVLINLVGASIGRCGIVPSSITDANINQAVAIIRLNYSLLPSYLMHLLLSPQLQKKIHGGKVETARPNISLEDLRQLVVPVPPLAEQRRIVAEVERRLSVCDKMEATITESLQKAESLRQSILKKSFEGKLLNKRELEEARNAPDWEPAEKLLERIRQEKARTGEKKRKR
jgi:type I restriction enzyme S subunit